ncbi:hypothetical protein Tco_0666728, partial [Tanacetum coccineum]
KIIIVKIVVEEITKTQQKLDELHLDEQSIIEDVKEEMMMRMTRMVTSQQDGHISYEDSEAIMKPGTDWDKTSFGRLTASNDEDFIHLMLTFSWFQAGQILSFCSIGGVVVGIQVMWEMYAIGWSGNPTLKIKETGVDGFGLIMSLQNGRAAKQIVKLEEATPFMVVSEVENYADFPTMLCCCEKWKDGRALTIVTASDPPNDVSKRSINLSQPLSDPTTIN